MWHGGWTATRREALNGSDDHPFRMWIRLKSSTGSGTGSLELPFLKDTKVGFASL